MNKNEKVTLMLTVIIFIVAIISSSTLSLVNAAEISPVQSNVTIYFFYGIGCPHCANVEASGVLERVEQNYTLKKLEVYYNATNQQIYTNLTNAAGIPQNQQGVPLVIIEKSGNYSYLVGDKPIINDLENTIQNFQPVTPSNPDSKNLTIWAVIVSALVDSINPCAFGVLAFLMISLLRIGSSKRALKAGIIYSFVVFLVYFLSGFGIFKVLQSFTSITHSIYLGVGILVLSLGAIQLIDVFLPGKFISLKIPTKAKPIIEKVAVKGTLPAIILLGAIVALFELPCTGGIYLGILSLMAANNSFGIGYLFLYNLIFILPLIIITLIIYKGTNPQIIERWSQKEKGWMKLASAIVMIALGIYILMF